jgi:predicted membrane chloride channel (bestrophin family)
VLRYLFGVSRTPKTRTLYNAARPFRVVGGVSDAEIELLQAARGALAKVALCSMWLQEFLSREYMAGSAGNVASPIFSRLFQYISDGLLGYNQARKIAYIPFPFPHAQLTSLFVLVVAGFMPILMLSFVTSEPLGFVLNFLTVMCFTGLHEVARELESPFQNVPNDIPLNNFQGKRAISSFICPFTVLLGY